MKASNKRVQRTRPGAVLPDDACPECGSPMREKRGRLKLPVNGEEITVKEAAHLSCSKCREVVLRFDRVFAETRRVEPSGRFVVERPID